MWCGKSKPRDGKAGLLVGMLALAIFAAVANCDAAAATALAGGSAKTEQNVDVLTYHGDPQRTGWNANETQLTVTNVGSSAFRSLARVQLDGRVDAQPLYVSGQTIAGQGVHDTVYVATERDTVFALDGATGAVLWSRSLGKPVPDQEKGDSSVFPAIGILSTPVIDLNEGALFVVADTFEHRTDTFVLHKIALDDGGDLVPPVAVALTVPIAKGKTWTFDPRVQLQRPALLEASGGIYVAFGSNGDAGYETARGAVLRYDVQTLALTASTVTNRQAEENEPFYLTSIWQSGYGPALGSDGSVFASTGNSNPNYGTYSKRFNHPEGVLKWSADLSTLLSSFTPNNYETLDEYNADFGSGGTMVVPDQPGRYPHMVVAGGKDGRAFLLNADALGGFNHNGPDRVIDQVQQGPCWCGPAYFAGSDGGARVVTAGGLGVTTWRLVTGSGKPSLAFEASTGSAVVQGLPDNGGVIPAISSNGEAAGSAIAWFVQRPQSSSDKSGAPVTLYAYDAMALHHRLFVGTAGVWRHAAGSNANIVPTVANGKVFVASDGELRIFGLARSKRSMPERSQRYAP